LLEKAPDMHLLPLNLPKGVPHVKGFSSWGNKAFEKSLPNTVRILPGELFDGFYIAKLAKGS
jgi:16S rRNA C967 or C1407 C5-methylase (RsmB/RsmF family)